MKSRERKTARKTEADCQVVGRKIRTGSPQKKVTERRKYASGLGVAGEPSKLRILTTDLWLQQH